MAKPKSPTSELRLAVEQVVEPYLQDYQPRNYRSSKVVRDVVWGMTQILPHELAIVDSPPFQRLRRLTQTSLAYLTYPCSIHSRFEHSIGAMTVMERVLAAFTQRGVYKLDDWERLELRMAALLHDCTHGPFSHSSEEFYKRDPIFDAIKKEYGRLFSNASASEIITYCFLTCDPFLRFWDRIKKVLKGPQNHELSNDFEKCDPWRIATMIIGADENPERPLSSPGSKRRLLRQLVNGPVDVDKLDYTARDGYFTGLNVAVDIERLLWVLDKIEVEIDDGTRAWTLCVNASGAPVLEQVLFAKMQLFSSVYHHHKVRAAHSLILDVLGRMKDASLRIENGRGIHVDIANPASFLVLDDHDLLQAKFSGNPLAVQECQRIVQKIRDRQLPTRALVLTHPVWGMDPQKPDDNVREGWIDRMLSPKEPAELIRFIATRARVREDEIFVDIPDEPGLQRIGLEALVKFDDSTYVAVQDMFPISGWLSAYSMYRLVSYILTTHPQPDIVGKAALDVLRSPDYQLDINDVALKLAHIDP